MMFPSLLVLVLGYLLGAVPFGYLLGRLRGVDLFQAGSGNIGATNAGRVLGARTGVLVFALDLLKGAVPVAVAAWIDDPHWLPVGAAVAAFLGHLFPVYLGFRGGKGVATGAGAVALLVPGPALIALATWLLLVLATRFVSLASLGAVAALSLAQLVGTPQPFDDDRAPRTLFCLIGSLIVVFKHRANIRRLLAGTESTLGDSPMRHSLVKILHVLAVGFWFGGAGFFNVVVAPSLFRTFEEVVRTAPTDRTANLPLGPDGADEATKKVLGSALAGAAVGPVFPKFFAMQTSCGIVAILTAWTWRSSGRLLDRQRVLIAGLALLTVAVGWLVAGRVTELRLARLDPDSLVAEAAKAAFAAWHLVSLALSFVALLLAGGLLALAAFLPSVTDVRADLHTSADESGIVPSGGR